MLWGNLELVKVKIWANTDMFSLFMLILLIIMVACMIVDIYGMHKSKKTVWFCKIQSNDKDKKEIKKCFNIPCIRHDFCIGNIFKFT